MISKQTKDLLWANHKTGMQFYELVASSSFSTQELEQAFLEVQYWDYLVAAIEIASQGNKSLKEVTICLGCSRIDLDWMRRSTKDYQK